MTESHETKCGRRDLRWALTVLATAVGLFMSDSVTAQLIDRHGNPVVSLVPVPVSLQVTSSRTSLLTGDTAQLTVRGTFDDGSVRDLTGASSGTLYVSGD